jgi:hypothetical protein
MKYENKERHGGEKDVIKRNNMLLREIIRYSATKH